MSKNNKNVHGLAIIISKNDRNSYCFLIWWSPNPRNSYCFFYLRTFVRHQKHLSYRPALAMGGYPHRVFEISRLEHQQTSAAFITAPWLSRWYLHRILKSPCHQTIATTYGLVIIMSPNHSNYYGLVKWWSPNHNNYYRFLTWWSPNPGNS